MRRHTAATPGTGRLGGRVAIRANQSFIMDIKESTQNV